MSIGVQNGFAMNGYVLLVPILLPLIGAFVTYAIGKKNRKSGDISALVTAIAELALVICTAVGYFAGNVETISLNIPAVCGLGLNFSLDGFRCIYMILTALMWGATTTVCSEYFSHEHNTNRYYLYVILTLSMTMGVFLSADLYTTFVFFEVMSFVSYVTVAQEETPDAIAGGKLYLGIAVFGGMMMLLGLMILNGAVGTVDISELWNAVNVLRDRKAAYAGGLLIAIGFAAKAGAFPLHIWLPKAHAVAPAPASAMLSGILTKTGIYGIMIVSVRIFSLCETWYLLVLIVGVVTMLTGAVLALFSINIKRTLACSSVSQIGFILIGLGIYGYSSLNEEYSEAMLLSGRGTILFMVNHTLVKMLLFLVAGMIYYNVHSLDLNDLRGFGRKKPLLAIQFAIGAFSLMGIPGTCGFIAKSFVHEGLVEFGEVCKEAGSQFLMSAGFFATTEKLFLLGSGMTAAYLIKLFVAIFIEKNEDDKVQQAMDARKKYMSAKSETALCIAMAMIPIVGLLPHKVLDTLANATGLFIGLSASDEYLAFYSFENIKGILICFIIGVIIYFGIIRTLFMREKRYVDVWPKWLDLEKYLYLPIIRYLCFLGRVVTRGLDSITDGLIVWLRRHVYNDELYEIDIVEGTAVTKAIGKRLNKHQERKNAHIIKKVEEGELEADEAQITNKDYVHEIALKYIWDRESRLVIFRTLSFGLFLFCIGFVLTMIYLLIKYIL